MMEGLISIIIPVYNASTYLSQCLDSVIRQTYRNIEIICIDDGSRDTSLSILYQYQKVENRLRIIAKDNAGVSAARNDGLRASKGEFIMFVDADDWIESDTCEIAIKCIENYDMVFWTYMKEYQESNARKEIFSSDCIFQGEEFKNIIYRRLFGLLGEELAHPENADAICTVWGKMYRKKHVANLSFVDLEEIGTYEDGLYNILACSQMTNARYINKALYHYRKTNGDSITSRYNPKLRTQWDRLYCYIQDVIDENGLSEAYSNALNNRKAMGLIGLGLNELCNPKRNKSRGIKEIITDEKWVNHF